MKRLVVLACVALCAPCSPAEEIKVDQNVLKAVRPIPSDEYYKKSVEINNLRKDRQVDIDTLLGMLRDKNTVVLDVRGDGSWKAMHIAGARHLSLADITPQTLARSIPSKDTRVVLYCDTALEINPTRMMAASTQAFPLVYQHGYTNLYEVESLWKTYMWNKPADETTRRKYEEYLKIPFEGDPKVIERERNAAKAVLRTSTNP